MGNTVNEAIMRYNIECMMENWNHCVEDDDYIKQDNEDKKYLESRYESLNLPHTVKRVIDDYIACVQTRDERFADLAYAAGVKDAIQLLKNLGFLNLEKTEISKAC